MASSPSYGERPPLQGFRRSFTAPHRQLSFHERAGLSNADADSDTLFTHPSVKIISFSPPPESIVSKSGETHTDADYPIDTVETLPWRSRTEDLVASGRMIIEKVRGSVWFLKCGSQFIYSILRNSQCWCVDAESRFVLRKGRLQYYRLELPSSTEEEKAKIEELKVAFSKVLKFERTPCPFQRGFHVDLPDDAITPRRKGKWTKKEGSLPATPDSNTPSLRRTKGTRSWSLQAQSPLPVPESRRQSDYSFAKRLYPTPPRREASAGLRPDTPSSTASSEEAASRGQRDDLSDSGSSLDEPASTDKRDLPRAPVDDTTDLEDHPTNSTVPEPGRSQDGSGDRSTSVSPRRLVISDEPPLKPSDALFRPVPEDDYDRTEPTNIRGAEDDIARAEYPMTEPVISAETSQHDEESTAQQLDGQGAPPEILSEGSSNILEDQHVSESEARSTSAAEHEGPSPEVGIETDLLDDQNPLDPSGLEDIPMADDRVSQSSEGLEVEDQSPRIPGARSEHLHTDDNMDDAASIASAAESYHTSASDDHASPQPRPEADPNSEHLHVRTFQHKRGVSEITITAATSDEQADGEQLDRFVTSDETVERPSTPSFVESSTSDDSWPDVKTPPNIKDGLRQRWNTRRALSPLPSSPNVFATQTQTQGNHMTSVLLQKACNLALVKPIELAVMVVHILARIAGGASLNDLLTGELFKRPDQHQRNSSFPDRLTPHQDDDEDDFGVPVRGRTRSSETEVSKNDRDTDADSMFDLD